MQTTSGGVSSWLGVAGGGQGHRVCRSFIPGAASVLVWVQVWFLTWTRDARGEDVQVCVYEGECTVCVNACTHRRVCVCVLSAAVEVCVGVGVSVCVNGKCEHTCW